MILDNLQRITSEYNRLLKGKKSDECPQGIGTVRFKILCNGNSEIVLNKAKSVLTDVVRNSVHSKKWPGDDEWPGLLPSWFIDRCAKELSEKEAENWLNWWKGLTLEEQKKVEKEEPWSLLDWLYWLHPSRRTWYWWDYEIINQDLCVIDIEVDEWPFPWESLEWLFRASGALSVVENEE